MKRHEYRNDGRVWFEDHICELADLLLGTEGIRYIYLQKRDRTWIRKLGDDGNSRHLLCADASYHDVIKQIYKVCNTVLYHNGNGYCKSLFIECFISEKST